MTAVGNVLRYKSVKGPVKIQIFTDAYSLNTSYRVFVDYEEKIRAITSMHLNPEKILESITRIYPQK